jgi:hypothetical protein
MKKISTIILLLWSLTGQAQTYVQINGASVHDRPGFNEFNYGAGLEQTITDRWTVAGGWFRNSEYRGSAYGYARYAVYKSGPWDIGIAGGLVTGYESYTVAPSLFPEVCYSYVCAVALPQVKTTGASALAVHLRLPIN